VRHTLVYGLFAALLAAAAAAVYFYLDSRRLEREIAPLRAENTALQQELARYKEHVVYLTGRLDEEIAKLSREKEEELARLRRTHEDMIATLEKEIQAGQVRITRLADRLSVNIVDRILFPSGEAEISEEGQAVLARVAKVLAQTRDKVIRIEGHTDNVPIHKRLRDRFPSNWELSALRATNVVRFLQAETGLDPAAFEAVGMGEYHPVADNATAEGRARNRRIEIVLYPRVKALAEELPRASGEGKGPGPTSEKP
jgi:chemotaxis protein MotB